VLDRNELTHTNKKKRVFKKDMYPLLKEKHRLWEKIPGIDALMAKMMFKGPGGRIMSFKTPEEEEMCNHPQLPLTMGSLGKEAALVWFFKSHKDELSACYCFLSWLDDMTTKFAEANDEFLLSRWNLLEKVWSSRQTIEHG
jgi:hypothetical protein